MKNKYINLNRNRMRLVPRQSTGLRQRNLFVVSIAILAIMGCATLMLNLAPSTKTYSATNGDYRSVATGDWSAFTTWQKYNGSAWVSANAAPLSSDGVITIQSGHTVTISSNITADQIEIDSGGTVNLISGKTLTLNNGTGIDFDVSGIFKNAGTVTLNPSANIAFENGGKYQHNFTNIAGTIPTATWNTGSICEVIGYTSNNDAPAGLQAFYNFTWNCPSQSKDINLEGGLTDVNGDFTVLNTGNQELRLSMVGSTISIGGDLNIQNGKLITSIRKHNDDTVNIAGNYIQTGGVFADKASSSTAVVNAFGNWSQTGGSISEKGKTTNMQIYFSKAGKQTFTASANHVSGDIDFIVKTGSALDMSTSILLGNDFTLENGSTLMIGSEDGINAKGKSGNIQTSRQRNFNTLANYVYNGLVLQVTGKGLPATVRNLEINNSTGVTLTNSVQVSNNLILTKGRVITEKNEELWVTNTSASAISGQSDSSYVDGLLRRNINTSGIYYFPLGNSSNYELMTVSLTTSSGISNLLASFIDINPAPNGVNNCHTNNGNGVIWHNKYIQEMLNNGYWDLTPDNALGTAVYGVELYSSGQTNNMSTNPANYVVLKRHDSNNSWAALGVADLTAQSVNSNRIKVKSTGLTDFSNFGTGQPSGGALPIQLLNFNVKPNGNVVNISWSTAVEKNNDYFTIERSNDGNTFKEIEKIKGAGNSNSVLNYRTTDAHPLPGTSYYRLKQTDFNGTFTYSPVRMVNRDVKSAIEKETIGIISVSPNPFSNLFSVNYNLETAGEVQVMLTSINGQIMFTEKIHADAGENYYDYQMDKNIPPGSYFLSLNCGDKKVTRKLIKSGNN